MINDISIHICDQDTTVDDFLSQFDFGKRPLTAVSFIDLNLTQGLIKIGGGKVSPLTNLDRIKAAYGDSQELADNVTNKKPGQIIIRKGTEVGIPNDSIKRSLSRTSQPALTQTSYSLAFISSVLRDLLRDPSYSVDIRSNLGHQVGQKDNNALSVFLWIRSINDWMDVSAFVDNVRTSVNASVGTFAFSLMPIKGSYVDNVGWQFDDVIGYTGKAIRNDVTSKVSVSKYTSQFDTSLNRERIFFNTVLQENDLVYIRHERLGNEREQQLVKEFDQNSVPGNVYDMIGLIDNVSTSTNSSNINISVQGRDLMKMLIEDGSYFFPEQYAQNLFTNDDSVLAKRNKLEAVGSALMSYSYSFKSIELVLKFIFNKFSNIGYIPMQALQGYGDELVKNKYELKKSQLKNNFTEIIELVDAEFNAQERQGLWTIIDLVFDPTAANRVMADNTIAQDNGSIINSIRKLCQPPFVEFFGDTYGDRYILTIRKPPFDEQGYKSLVYGNEVFDKVSDNINYTGRAYQAKVKRDKRKQLRVGRPSALSEIVIDIDESQVIDDNLEYHNEAYSWYRIVPRGLGNISNLASFNLAPIVPLDEYAQVWGNKMYTVENNYSPAEFIQDDTLDDKLSYAESQTFHDLRFLVQSNTYLPFARTGTIKITGNRLIKRGYFIYYKPTNEVFYVDGVSQIRGTNVRQTVLQVSRGMREPFIKGQIIEGIKNKVSYFDIVDTTITNNASINNRDFLKNWRVNPEVFDFFIQRRQWDSKFDL